MNAHDAASSFLVIFERDRRTRMARGTPTDDEQDLLRAMLIFASSGLDSMVKQLTLDALPSVIRVNTAARESLRAFVERRIKRGENIDTRFVSAALSESDHQGFVLNELIESIRNSSAQSREQLNKIAAHFAIDQGSVIQQPKKLEDIFVARNEIAHEMDVDFTQTNRSRRPRRRDTMVDYTNHVFDIANRFLKEVDSRIA